MKSSICCTRCRISGSVLRSSVASSTHRRSTVEGGIDLAALALFRDVQDHFLNIFPRLEMIATIAEYVN